LVLLDALRNAVRYARESITIRLEPVERSICFVVSDDGPGFPPEILAGANAAMTPGSTGLGLRFARLIASRHTTPDGRCGAVELRNNSGAEFRLYLP
jgi:signal transduction histidine kinase